MSFLTKKIKVRILRAEPNSIRATSSQFVRYAEVSEKIGLLFEDLRKGRKTYDETLFSLANFAEDEKVIAPQDPVMVYVNIHSRHASIYFIQSDLVTPQDDDEEPPLRQTGRAVRVYMRKDRFHLENPHRFKRVDLYTENGLEFNIVMSYQDLKAGSYEMFKCFELIDITDVQIEWAYLMAAQDWYDTATNNCLSFSKRIITELYKQIMNGEELEREDLRQLNKLYISSSSETVVDGFQSRLSSFLNPIFRFVAVIGLIVLLFWYVKFRYDLIQNKIKN